MSSQEQTSKDYEAAVKKALGNDPQTPQKIERLRDKWRIKNHDSEVGRIIHPILFMKSLPINNAIIADNLDYFQANYKEECNGNYEVALIRACLCGSQKIADFLLSALKSSYTAEDRTQLLAYISASMNTRWVREVARAMVEAGRSMPKAIYSLASSAVIDTLVEIFKSSKDKSAITQSR